MGRSRIRKIKALNTQNQPDNNNDVFYMNLEEAKAAIAHKYEFLEDRYERKYPKHKGLA